MVVGSFTRENVSRIGVERIWKAGILDGHTLIPRLLPEFVKSVEILEGDGGIGTVKKFHFTEAVKEFRFAVDKTEVLDHENHVVKHTIIDGGLIGSRLKSYSIELTFVSVSQAETLEKIKVDYETLDETPLSAEEEEQVLTGLSMMTKAIEGYLLANSTAYA